MAMQPAQSQRGPLSFSLPIYALTFSALLYCFARVLIAHLHREDGSLTPVSNLDQAEKGSLGQKEDMSEDEVFQLEKRAFISKTWLFVCHDSRFSKPGDYHAYDVAGISFFVVLGKDNKLRAFHNVCRHRAYTVVRKSCGNSTRFSCKYHGWQYDDKGALLKAPKFDDFPGFVHDDNGLYAVKLIRTREGLIFINFDASTMHLPFDNVKSHIDLGDFSWVDGMEATSATNWKKIANDFAEQVQWSQNPFGWFPAVRRAKVVALLGPMSIIKQFGEDMWYTIVLLPRSSSEVVIRCDMYAKEGHVAPVQTIEKWKWTVKQELMSSSVPESKGMEPESSKYFAYQCGGRTIDLLAILTRHLRSEQLVKRKLQPAIRVTGTADHDAEAEALCNALDSAAETRPSSLETCSRISSFPQAFEW